MGKNQKYLLLLSLLFIAYFLIFSPFYYNAPFNDDWAYAKSVEYLLDDGEVKIFYWVQQSIVVQVFVGTIFSALLGANFTSLKIATFFISLIGITSFFYLLRVKQAPLYAFLGSLVLFFNPIFFQYIFSFMTENYWISFLLASMFFYTRKEKSFNLLLGGFFLALAVLVRQQAIIVLLPLGIYLWLKSPEKRKTMFYGLALPILLTIIYLGWYHFIHGPTAGYKIITRTIVFYLTNFSNVNIFVDRFFESLMYLGFFTFPIIIGFYKEIVEEIRKNLYSALIFFSSLLFILFEAIQHYYNPNFNTNQLMFYFNNVIYNLGVGPLNLKGQMLNQTMERTIISTEIMFGFTILTGIFAVTILFILIVKGVETIRERERKKETFLFFTILSLFLLIISISPIFFDRYIMMLVPFTLILLFSWFKKPLLKPIIIGLVLISLFSFITTQDYFTWTKTKGIAFDSALNEFDIPLEEMDAGLALNGYYLGEKIPFAIQANKSPWWVVDDKYAITMYIPRGYEALKEFSYQSFLAPNGKIYLVERK